MEWKKLEPSRFVFNKDLAAELDARAVCIFYAIIVSLVGICPPDNLGFGRFRNTILGFWVLGQLWKKRIL